jgi:hypothetical protein
MSLFSEEILDAKKKKNNRLSQLVYLKIQIVNKNSRIVLVKNIVPEEIIFRAGSS